MIHCRQLITPIVFASLVLTANSASAAREATLYYVNNFSGPGECTGSDLSWGDNTVGYLRTKLNDWSFDNVYYHGNKWLDFRDVTDISYVSSGRDHVSEAGIDSADIGMIYTHGNYSCSGGSQYSSLVMGDSGSTCSARYGTTYSSNDVDWGDTDLNAMVIYACNSAQWCVWNNSSYYQVDGNFAMLLGFHGITYESRTRTRNFEDFVDDSRVNGLGDNWLDEITDKRWGSDNDVCPVAVVYEDTRRAANSTFNNMGFKDWKTPGSHTTSYYYYIDGCDPLDGKEL